MGLHVLELARSIETLSISGVQVRGLSNIPRTVEERECPILYPKPDGFLSGLTVVRESYGGDTATGARKTAYYTLTYRFLFEPLGTGRENVFDQYQLFVTRALAIIEAFIANSSLGGVTDITPPDVVAMGPVSDQAGTMFHGCDFPLKVMDFWNEEL